MIHQAAYNIKRWYLMFTGKSVWHVNQDLGKCFSRVEIRGYYNNMTEKVTKMPELLETEELPKLNLAGGQFTYFPVAIFQYGLGAYDLYLQTSDKRYKHKFLQCVSWALGHQDEQGRWNNFSHYCPETPYGAMAQGEGASLLIRAYIHSGDNMYLLFARRALDFMVQSVTDGGTSTYLGEDVIFNEYTHLPIVMNGWIFAWFGLYDYVLATNDTGKYKSILDRSSNTLIKYLPRFTTWYWSKYDLSNKLASPFYHNLHIAQMQAMYQLTGRSEYNEFAIRWERYQKNFVYKSLAFVIKATQKIFEKD